MSWASSGTSAASRDATIWGLSRRITSCTSISLVTTISTMSKAICAVLAGTIPCQPTQPSGWNTSHP